MVHQRILEILWKEYKPSVSVSASPAGKYMVAWNDLRKQTIELQNANIASILKLLLLQTNRFSFLTSTQIRKK